MRQFGRVSVERVYRTTRNPGLWARITKHSQTSGDDSNSCSSCVSPVFIVTCLRFNDCFWTRSTYVKDTPPTRERHVWRLFEQTRLLQ
ncbi:hypothetical protein GBAR_LOCUS15288 [Geodia barretti]|uniref:Uncharacterized protein n=1 Tax=Geodia barretti TaxID=519541 RepID=A0AA35SBI4_GEOBA|nr:hypothetical protein GBAR_LOCUS15288 [Geodia barretti]